MGPVGHLGIPVPVAHTLRLNLVVTGFCALLPDIVDKPLRILGLGNGRYVAHSLLFVFLVALAFSFKKRASGWSALLGGISHLVLDWSPVPWFYPFVSYDFCQYGEYSLLKLLYNYISFSGLGKEMIWVASVWLAVLAYQWFSVRFRKRSKPGVHHGN